jgi:chromosome segregation ATPase
MDQQAWSQATGRIGSLEDLLRRNEGSLGAALGRVKDVETALNTMHRALGRIGPDLSATIDEVKGAKRRLDVVDAAAQSKIRDVEGSLQQEIRANKPIPLGSDPVFQRLASDHNTASADLQETISQVRRLTDAVSADGKALRAVESDARWLGEQVRDQVAAHRDLSNSTTRRLEQVSGEIHSVQEEVRTVDAGLRKIIDAAVQASREELVLRLEQETKARVALQADFVAAFGQMRDDVIKGFSETATNLKNLDETSHSLETVLRAEVRSRMSAQEEFGKRVDGVEERLRREALSAAEYLKALDTQMSAALRDVRDVSASECRSQLDTVWRSVDDLSDQVKKIHSKQTAENATNEEIAATRTKMLVDAAVQDSREEVMKAVNSRIASATADIEGCATKSEVHELRTRLELKLQEVDRRAEGGRTSSVKFDASAAPEHSSSTSTAMRLKKVSDRVDDAEKQLLVVAEAVRDVHEELVEKLERVETQSAALDALQKSLQSTFERDQASMQEQNAALRGELVGVMEELEKIRPPPSDEHAAEGASDDTPKRTGDSGSTPSTPHGATGASGSSPPASPSARFSHRALEQQIRTVRQDLSALQHDTRRDTAELKTQQEQLYDRHVAMTKTHRDDTTTLKADIAAVSDRAQQNAEQISDRLHTVTEASNNNFAKLNEDVAAIAEGKALAPRTEPATGTAELHTASSEAVATLRGDVKDLKSKLADVDAKVREHTDAIADVSVRTDGCAKRIDALGMESAQPTPANDGTTVAPKTPPGDSKQSRPQSKTSEKRPESSHSAAPGAPPATEEEEIPEGSDRPPSSSANAVEAPETKPADAGTQDDANGSAAKADADGGAPEDNKDPSSPSGSAATKTDADGEAAADGDAAGASEPPVAGEEPGAEEPTAEAADAPSSAPEEGAPEDGAAEGGNRSPTSDPGKDDAQGNDAPAQD